jgi:hypothetical protein
MMRETRPIGVQTVTVPDSLKSLKSEFMDAYKGEGYQGKKQSMKYAGYVIAVIWLVVPLLAAIAKYYYGLHLGLSIIFGTIALLIAMAMVFFTVTYLGNAKRLYDAEKKRSPYRLFSEYYKMRNPKVVYAGIVFFNIETLSACIEVWNWYLKQKSIQGISSSSAREKQVRKMILRRLASLQKIMDRIELQGIEIVGWTEESSRRYFDLALEGNSIDAMEHLAWKAQRLMIGSPSDALIELHAVISRYESHFGFINRHLLAPSTHR